MENQVSSYDFIGKYKTVGPDRFYKYLLVYGVDKLAKMKDGYSGETNPEVEFLEYHDRFMVAFRKSGEKDFLNLAKVFRRAAHKIYRASLKAKLTQKDVRFLNVVQKASRK